MYKLLKCLIYCGIIFVCAGRPGLPPTRERRGCEPCRSWRFTAKDA